MLFVPLPISTSTLGGDSVTTTGGRTVTVAAAFFDLSALEVAVMDTVAGFGRALGAVYKPPEVIVPQLAFEQPVPDTDQITEWSETEPLTVAENCAV